MDSGDGYRPLATSRERPPPRPTTAAPFATPSARVAADVEAIWRDGGALEGATAEAVERTVRGTIAVSRHYEKLIEQQKFNRGKYGEGDVLSDDHADPAWVAARLCLVGRMTGVPSEDVPGMVELSGAGILSLTASSAMRALMAIKDLIPNADASHMVRTEPDLLLADIEIIAHGGRDVMETLRGMDMPEPCVRLLVSEEPGLILGKGGRATRSGARSGGDARREFASHMRGRRRRRVVGRQQSEMVHQLLLWVLLV